MEIRSRKKTVSQSPTISNKGVSTTIDTMKCKGMMQNGTQGGAQAGGVVGRFKRVACESLWRIFASPGAPESQDYLGIKQDVAESWSAVERNQHLREIS
jgi:hypothetical protein